MIQVCVIMTKCFVKSGFGQIFLVALPVGPDALCVAHRGLGREGGVADLLKGCSVGGHNGLDGLLEAKEGEEEMGRVENRAEFADFVKYI